MMSRDDFMGPLFTALPDIVLRSQVDGEANEQQIKFAERVTTLTLGLIEEMIEKRDEMWITEITNSADLEMLKVTAYDQL